MSILSLHLTQVRMLEFLFLRHFHCFPLTAHSFASPHQAPLNSLGSPWASTSGSNTETGVLTLHPWLTYEGMTWEGRVVLDIFTLFNSLNMILRNFILQLFNSKCPLASPVADLVCPPPSARALCWGSAASAPARELLWEAVRHKQRGNRGSNTSKCKILTDK